MMKFGIVGYLKNGGKCILKNDYLWVLINKSENNYDISVSAREFNSYLQAKHWLIQNKHFDNGKLIKIIQPSGQLASGTLHRVRIELLKRIDKPVIPSKKDIKSIFENTSKSKNTVWWGVHFNGSVKVHEHINLSMRDIKEGFGIHPLKVPSDLIQKYGVNAYVDKLYRRVLYTWLVHLMSNQTERLVAFSTFSEKEIIEKIYSLYEAIDFEDYDLYTKLVSEYKKEISNRVIISEMTFKNKIKRLVKA
ncbi:hypothetical protein [Bacillus cereus]|uniref:hypothetical protein n=1 Tax=Bacillus cereus TaxID=1396 RepID=UPI00211D4F5E|nr:hypothetical protein [Bacillus cereus]